MTKYDILGSSYNNNSFIDHFISRTILLPFISGRFEFYRFFELFQTTVVFDIFDEILLGKRELLERVSSPSITIVFKREIKLFVSNKTARKNWHCLASS